MADRSVHAPAQVLVVEDDQVSAAIVRHLLMGAGFTVVTTSTLADAKSAIGQRDFELLLLDVVLPDGDGITWLSTAAEQIVVPPTIVMTAVEGKADLNRAIAAGAQDFVAKPIAPNLLLQRIDLVIHQQRILRKLRQNERLVRKAMDVAGIGTIEIADVDGELRAAVSLEALGCTPQRDLGILQMLRSVAPRDRRRVVDTVRRVLRDQATEATEITFSVVATDGSERLVRAWWEVERSGRPLVTSASVILQDVTSWDRQQQRIDYVVHHDLATGALNQSGLMRAVTGLHGDDLQREMTAMMVGLERVDLETLRVGARGIDQVLGALVGRLERVARSHGQPDVAVLVGRWTPNTLAVVVSDATPAADHSVADATPISQHPIVTALIEALEEAIELPQRQVAIAPSVGIAQQDGSTDLDELIARAQVALHDTAEQGRRVCWYSPQRVAVDIQRFELVDELEKAIRKDEIAVAFQPQVDPDLQIVSYEALARWQHPIRGAIAPDLFIGLAEDRGLIVDLGRVVRRKVAQQWLSKTTAGDVSVAINVAPEELRVPRFGEELLELCDEFNLDPRRVEIEITERSMLSASPLVAENLGQLRNAGVLVAIDDFGAGFSSLASLLENPVDVVKIDRSVTAHVDHSTAFIRGVLLVAESIGATVVAEGVETQRQHQQLVDLGVTRFQGYLYGRPEVALDSTNDG